MGESVDLTRLLQLRRLWKQEGQTVVFTNGCFDLIHPGHVSYLRQARELGDLLVVGLNSDDSARRIKGPRRPFLAQRGRIEMLTAMEMVDYVVVFDEDTAEALVSALRPDIYTKGGDYSSESKDLPEAQVVKGYGGHVEILPLMPAHSTSALIELILERYSRDETAGPTLKG
jgi:D-beta-D-heptose 7-phosphate kinase/D-beta-D-heptose 1-phosphate adenosyltransferase